jgi:hypothetical protein
VRGGTIARSIALVMKRIGGQSPESIRRLLFVLYGWKHTHCQQVRNWRASKTRARWSSTTVIGETSGMIGRRANEAEISTSLQISMTKARMTRSILKSRDDSCSSTAKALSGSDAMKQRCGGKCIR